MQVGTAAAIVFLVTRSASYITGSVMDVNGGYLAQASAGVVYCELCDRDRQRHRRTERADAPCDAVCRSGRYAVSEQHAPEPQAHVGDDEPDAQRVVGNEAHVPCV